MEQFAGDFYLLDSWSAGYGGSGAGFSWEWLDGLNTEKLILSGGLSIENVGEAIRRIHPYGVDVCSGVETRPGIKDHAKLKEFILAAKGASSARTFRPLWRTRLGREAHCPALS